MAVDFYFEFIGLLAVAYMGNLDRGETLLFHSKAIYIQPFEANGIEKEKKNGLDRARESRYA